MNTPNAVVSLPSALFAGIVVLRWFYSQPPLWKEVSVAKVLRFERFHVVFAFLGFVVVPFGEMYFGISAYLLLFLVTVIILATLSPISSVMRAHAVLFSVICFIGLLMDPGPEEMLLLGAVSGLFAGAFLRFVIREKN